jgi:hypothetical protein
MLLTKLHEVRFDELHNRFTYVAIGMKTPHDLPVMVPALVVLRFKENAFKTPYVCYYVGLDAKEFAALAKLPDSVLEPFSFFGIPNETIDLSHTVSQTYLFDKPAAYLGTDRPAFNQAEFESFVALCLEIKDAVAWNPNDLSSLSSKMLLASPTATKESSAESAEQVG